MASKVTTFSVLVILGTCLSPSLGQDFTVDLTTGSTIAANRGLSWYSSLSGTGSCGKQGVLKLTFNDSDRKRAEVKMSFVNPTDWVFNIGDSSTNNGYAGDAGTQHNDAEVQGKGTDLRVYGKDVDGVTGQSYGLLYRDSTFVQGQVTLNIKDMEIQGTNGQNSFYMDSCNKLFALSGQSDLEGPVNYDVYFAMNRVVAGNYRSGTGLCTAEVTWYSE